MPFQIIRNDIPKVEADIIVNTANPEPIVGDDSAVYQAAGKESLLEERIKIGKLSPGQADITPAFDLSAKYIIHTVVSYLAYRHFLKKEKIRICSS